MLLLAAAGPALGQCPLGQPPDPVTGRCDTPVPPPATSIAVLDFQNRSPRDTLAAAQAAEFVEALTERLQLVERLQVASRSAVRALGPGAANMRPATIGSRLGVQYFVTGTVQRFPGRIRITAELVRASNGRRVWSQQLERSEFDLPTEFAVELAGAVLGTLRPREQAALAPPTDSTAFVNNTVAVLPFQGPAGDTALQPLADRVRDLMTRRLQDGNLPRAADPAEVRAAWLRFGGADTLTDAVAQAYRVGRFTRAPLVLRGEARREGARVRLGATLYWVPGRERLAQRSIVTTPDSAEAIADVLLLQAQMAALGFAEHTNEWLSRRSPDAVRRYVGPPAGTITRTSGWYRSLLEIDSLLIHPIVFGRASAPGTYPWFGQPFPWFDTLVTLAFQRRGALPREDRLLTEGVFGPWFGWADDAEARIRLWGRITEEVPQFFLPWEWLASQLTYAGPLTSIPDWRGRAVNAINSALRAHDSCITVVNLGFWFHLFQGDTAAAARLAAIAARRGYRGTGSTMRISPVELMPHALAAVRGDLSDTLYWMRPQPRPSRPLVALARAVPSAVPTADAVFLAWEDTEEARRPGWNHWGVGYYWRERGDWERWRRHLSLQLRTDYQGDWLDEITDDAILLRDAIYHGVPEDARTQNVLARMTRIANGDSVPAPRPGVVGVAHCWLAQWRLSHRDTTGVPRAIAYLRDLDARDRAGLLDGMPNVHRWDVCPALLEAQLAQVTGRDQLAKARALDALLRPLPLIRRGINNGLDGSASHDQTQGGGAGSFQMNLRVARLLAAAGDTAGALAATRRRPRDMQLLDNCDNLIDYLREEGRYAAAMADTVGALDAYDHYLGLRRERPAYEPWAREWDEVRTQVAALRRRE